jgi:trimeric autotransporter adhesin
MKIMFAGMKSIFCAALLATGLGASMYATAGGAPGASAELEQRVAELEVAVEILSAQLEAIQANPALALGSYVSVSTDTINELIGPHVIITGANVHVRDGSGATFSGNTPTTGIPTGLGNLIVGYNEDAFGNIDLGTEDRTGSHNLVVGMLHSYTSYGGVVAGYRNTSGDSFASAFGLNNQATGDFSIVVGGSSNTASGTTSTVSGGLRNVASGFRASISGGIDNTASGPGASVSGGSGNTASEEISSISGGFRNTASGQNSSVSGGSLNTASGIYSHVSGGGTNVASGANASVSGGGGNAAIGASSSVSGGADNSAAGVWATVGGGFNRQANGQYNWAAGGLFQLQ